MMRWRRFKARLAYRREKKKEKVHSPELSGFCLLTVSLLVLYCILFPRHAGVIGAMIARSCSRSFGQGAYLLCALIAYRGVKLLLHREDRRPWRYVLVDALLLVACVFICRLLWFHFSGYQPWRISRQSFDGHSDPAVSDGGALSFSPHRFWALCSYGARGGHLAI